MALKPLLDTELSEMKLTTRALLKDVVGRGNSVPQ